VKETGGGTAVFLDLQGTLGGDGLGDIRDFTFFPEAFPAIRRLHEIAVPVFTVTNQSHIAKGLFTLDAFNRRMTELLRELTERGAGLDGVYCCPHSEQDNCTCRKPRTGLLEQAQGEFALDLSRCYVVGDSGAWDIVMARRAGCKAILVRSGLGESSLGEYRHLWKDTEPDFLAADILQAAEWIVRMEGISRPRTAAREGRP
jgi:D-glycero-D-manno-heptose 1,7-bisphosphate phosphatase